MYHALVGETLLLVECFAHHVLYALVGERRSHLRKDHVLLDGERLSHLRKDHVLQLGVGPSSGRLQETVLSLG